MIEKKKKNSTKFLRWNFPKTHLSTKPTPDKKSRQPSGSSPFRPRALKECHANQPLWPPGGWTKKSDFITVNAFLFTFLWRGLQPGRCELVCQNSRAFFGNEKKHGFIGFIMVLATRWYIGIMKKPDKWVENTAKWMILCYLSPPGLHSFEAREI